MIKEIVLYKDRYTVILKSKLFTRLDQTYVNVILNAAITVSGRTLQALFT